jgi:hypothetical protein
MRQRRERRKATRMGGRLRATWQIFNTVDREDVCDVGPQTRTRVCDCYRLCSWKASVDVPGRLSIRHFSTVKNKRFVRPRSTVGALLVPSNARRVVVVCGDKTSSDKSLPASVSRAIAFAQSGPLSLMYLQVRMILVLPHTIRQTR